MWSKVIAKINSLTQVQKVIIIAVITTVILSCGIIIFFAAINSDSDTISTSTTPQSDNHSDSDLTITESAPETSDTTPTSTPSTDDRPELMSTSVEKPISTNTPQSTPQSTTSKPTTSTTTTIPTPVPEDPICGGDKKTTQGCIVQKMYGTPYPTGHIFAYDIANYYHRILNHVTPNVTNEISLSGDSSGALKMITKDLRQNETDSVSVHFYAYMTNDGWQASWEVYVSKLVKVDEKGVKHYTVYSQFGKNRLSAEERQAITDRYIPAYTKEIRETQALYEQKYLTWYNSTK